MLYIACKFREEDSRAYTYEWDGEPLEPGDLVKVPDRSGDGWKRVIVASVSDQAPSFPCKPILGRYEPEQETVTDHTAPPESDQDAPSDIDAPLTF